MWTKIKYEPTHFDFRIISTRNMDILLLVPAFQAAHFVSRNEEVMRAIMPLFSPFGSPLHDWKKSHFPIPFSLHRAYFIL